MKDIRKILDAQDNKEHCDHTGPQQSLCVTCRTLECYERYVKVDVSRFKVGAVSADLKVDTDSWFKEQLDMKSLKTLAKLKLELETFTVKELRELYRKSRVAIVANFTNNRHVHDEILREIEACRVVTNKREKRRKTLESLRGSSLANYRKTLQEFQEAHDRLVDVTQTKFEAEEQHACWAGKLEKAKVYHDDVVSQHRREFELSKRRERKNSL